MSKAITKECMALLKEASEMFDETGCVPGFDGELEFIAAVRAKVADATDAEILAAVRYGGALEVREIDQIDRYMTAQGEPNDEDDNEAGRYLLASPYVAAAAALEEYIRVNRKGSSGGSIRCC
jgi:hypothetical protein